MEAGTAILTVNGGSSSLKFAVYAPRADDALAAIVRGTIDCIGRGDASLATEELAQDRQRRVSLGTIESPAAANQLIESIDQLVGFAGIAAVGHRVVHGGPHYTEPATVSSDMLAELKRLSPFDPDHLPTEIALIETFAARFPRLRQVACFDTAFHSQMPRVAQLLPIPRRFERQGIRRYGFHGLSYAFLLEELERRAGRNVAMGRVILAHLGAGASLAAVLAGRSIDTSMAFTPTAGLPMATRSGDLDPGLVRYLADVERMSPAAFHDMVNHESGLLGVSETSSDVRDLLAAEATDVRAAEALALFCYQTKKWIGAFAAALGGLDTLVFSAGIGEHSAEIRRRVCQGLGFLGLTLDETKNVAAAPLISGAASRVAVHVIHTDEELMIARATRRLLGETPLIA